MKELAAPAHPRHDELVEAIATRLEVAAWLGSPAAKGMTQAERVVLFIIAKRTQRLPGECCGTAATAMTTGGRSR
ncbi:hypothetical protein [Nonomuraea sp. NPDC050310]|uniref:hypothetical protein n=1 Tax=Nonomuraea sp. NPDC050310 TaxID=3154935 RepID=UPI0033C9ED1B